MNLKVTAIEQAYKYKIHIIRKVGVALTRTNSFLCLLIQNDWKIVERNSLFQLQ